METPENISRAPPILKHQLGTTLGKAPIGHHPQECVTILSITSTGHNPKEIINGTTPGRQPKEIINRTTPGHQPIDITHLDTNLGRPHI